MRAYRAIGVVLSSVAAVSLALAGLSCGAQDVIYVDDLNSPAAQTNSQKLPSLTRGRTGAAASRRQAQQADYRELSREQVAKALSEQAQRNLDEKKAGPLSRLSSKFKSFFTRDDTIDAAPDPYVTSQGPSSAVQQAGYNGSRGVASPTPVQRRDGGLALRQGDQRKGLLDGALSSNQSTPNRSRSATPSAGNTRKPASWGRGGDVGSTISKTASPQTNTRSLKLTSQADSKPSDGVVFVSDIDSPPQPRRTPELATSPKPLPSHERASEPLAMVSDQPLAPRSSRTVESTAAPKPLVVENPSTQAPKPLALATMPAAPTSKVDPLPKPTSSAPASQSPRVAHSPKAAQQLKPIRPQPVTVFPNPVEVAEQQTPQTTQRAASLLAEAHTLAATAKTEEDFTRVVQQCRHVLAIDDSPLAVQYSNDLAAWALNKRGELKADQQRDSEAMVDFDEAVRKDAGRWRAVHNRGVLLAQAGRFADAFEAFNQTIELNPEFAKAYSNRASLYVQAGEFRIALADYKKAISLDPDLVIAHKGRGRVCHVVGQLEQALRHFEAAVLLDPDDASIATCRADLLTDMGRYAQASAGYQQAIEIDPQLATAYRNLAWLQATCPEEDYRDGRQAIANAQQAMQLAGGADDICLDTLAAAQATAGDFAGAVETIKQAIALAPASDQPEYNQRLELYQAGRAFLSTPSRVQQASYEQTKTK